MLVASIATSTLGWIFIIVGLVLIVLAIPPILKKVYAVNPEGYDWPGVIGLIIEKLGAAGVVLVLGVGFEIVGLILIGVKLPSLS
jgi:hypothetical protein